MTRAKDLCHPETVRVAASHQAEAENIAAELAAIAATGMILPGSITQRPNASRLRPRARFAVEAKRPVMERWP
jgi:hypothetical protein